MSDMLKNMLMRDEGLRLRPYRDTTGKLTIGYGRNLDDVGITREEASWLLDNDIDLVETMLDGVEEYQYLDEPRQDVIANMCFNIGYRGLMSFKRMWAAIARQDFDAAADEMLDSKWAIQVGQRAVRLAQIMRTGKYDN